MDHQRPGNRRGNRAGLVAAAGLVVCMLVGCSATGGSSDASVTETVPSHPFPRWVSALETGITTREQIEARFGSPDEIGVSRRSGEIWRYSFPEVRWVEVDGGDGRPGVSAQERARREEPTGWDQFREGADRALDWMSRAVFYPPAQPRPARLRRVPATIHDLELVFEVDGTLQTVRYAPGSGTTLVPQDG